ncbi:MAG: tetratricopeptide repeat protein [Opitutae bacterium]|nr:tetratricopeptide repeat protein [Opitutae bacterium]
MRNFARALVLLSLLPTVLPAQTPSPLASESVAAAAVPGAWIVAEGRANSALQAGFPATAAAGYREMLAAPGLPTETRQRVTLALATALLDASELAEAEKALSTYDGPRNGAYQLRAGLLAAVQRRLPPAKAALATIKVEELSATDRGWWFYLQALLADADGNNDRAKEYYEQAKQTAVSALQRARFELAYESSRLRDAPRTEQRLAVLRGNMEQFAGQDFGYDVARNYAAALSVAGRKIEALAVLQRQLAVLAPGQRRIADQMLLLTGLIAGERSPTGQNALIELLNKAQQPETQRTALFLLARGAKAPAEREQLRSELGKLIGAPTLHPIIEDLLLVRAQAALADQQYNAADDDARLLLERYPGSPLKSAALGVRLSVAWELKRYRSAADFATQLRATVPAGRDRAELGVLLAEAFFRSGDYQNAADAYDAALREAPQVVPAGVLIFQRVLADIRGGAIEAAAKLLDDTAGNAAFDAVNRWQAEWNLVKEMQVRGLGAAALARVEKLLAQGAQGVPAELRIRLLWLRAKLSFDNGQPEAALKQVDDLTAALPGAQLDAALRGEVASTAQLLKAQALLTLQRDAEAGALLDKLRVDFKASKAAEYSYIVQATNLSERGETVKAQQLLIKLADDHKESEFAPLALYEAALCAERRGLDDTLREAYRLLERLVQDYPRDELMFYARLKQGDLLRKLNDFGAARQFYENLINNYGQHPDVLLAQLALADSLFAQGGNSVVNYESASAIYERLRDLPQAPVDLRAEAGYKWGYALAKRGQGAKAATVFWSVVDAFLLEAKQAAALGGKGRYWIARTLLELGQLHEDAGRLDEAQRAYQLIVDYKLNGAAQAQAKLARFRATAPEGAKP